MSTPTAPPVSKSPAGRGLLWAGIALCFLGIGLTLVQFAMQRMAPPWQLPILTTLGAVLLVVAVAKRRSVLRVLVLVLVTAFAGLEWFFLVSFSRLPPYEGSARAGQPVPAFQTSLADGRSFTDRDLRDGRHSVMVFFRGRW